MLARSHSAHSKKQTKKPALLIGVFSCFEFDSLALGRVYRVAATNVCVCVCAAFVFVSHFTSRNKFCEKPIKSVHIVTIPGNLYIWLHGTHQNIFLYMNNMVALC